MASVGGPRPACGVHHPVPSSGVRRSSRPVSGRLASSVSSVHPSGVHPSGGQPAAVRPVGPDASVSSHLGRWRCGPGRCGGQPAPQERVEVPVGVTPWSGSVDGRAGPDAGDAAGVARWSVGVGSGPGPGWVRAAAALDRWGTRQGWPACGARSLTAALWAREQAAARGGRSGRVAAALGLGWGRPRWVVVVVPDARVDGPGRASGRAGGDGRAAPSRPRLAAGAPGSLPAAL